ncbi:flagellar hook-basal body complex protein FliE [Salinarimonas soli]|uniref:Flagellar hook-basal body complex protein FliE n=1 Tax=Salinarimonas soli TaxID=1638099 RepID=A0A5B2V7M3_9HYPH|nr:flagellar hook-basal body complex protein FliE [Salinarimonas soli]KAA2234816.1 flagellar hook-basal body complex protein FliE [Salinarimonas soli]
MTINAFGAGAYAATQNLVGLGAKKAPGGTAGAGAAGGAGEFGGLLKGALDGVGQTGRKAEMQMASAAAGKADIVDVVTAVAESEAALETLVAVRDRVIAAYEEIMRMPI